MRPASHPVAFWLIPAEPMRSALAALIAALAKEHAAPAFTPHVTLCSGQCREPVTPTLVAEVLAQARLPSVLDTRVIGVGHSDDFFRTVFLELQQDPALDALRAQVRDGLAAAGHAAGAKPFRPHLSLIYKRCSSAARARIASAIDSLAVIPCDTLAAIAPASGSWQDVAAWRVVHEQSLRA